MTVKWNGKISTERKLNGGGPQGATFGIWEYLAQSNNSADSVDPNYRYKQAGAEQGQAQVKLELGLA